MTTQKLHILVTKGESEGKWLAICLEHCIAVQGGSIQEACERWERMLLAQLILAAEDDSDPFEDLPPAEEKYWKAYEEAGLSLQLRPPEAPISLPQIPSVRAMIAELRAAA
jgi:hypothetical protein